MSADSTGVAEVMAEPTDTLLLTYRKEQFSETQVVFEARIAAYVTDATTRTASIVDATDQADAKLAWARYRALTDIIERVRDRISAVRGSTGAGVEFRELEARLASLIADRNAARTAFLTVVDPSALTLGRTRSIPLTAVW